MTAPKITVSNWKSIHKNSLLGTFDLEFTGMGLRIKGAMLLETNGRRWINFPSKEYQKNGERKFMPFLEWRDRETSERFSAAVVPLVEDLQRGVR